MLEQIDSGGTKANRHGKTAESVIACLLSEKGWDYQRGVRLYKSIYGRDVRVDFLVTKPRQLVIESKWQQSSGSVDEKFPYLLLNIRQRCPYSCVIVSDGMAAREDAVSWLKSQVDDDLIGVFTLAEFMVWLSRQ